VSGLELTTALLTSVAGEGVGNILHKAVKWRSVAFVIRHSASPSNHGMYNKVVVSRRIDLATQRQRESPVAISRRTCRVLTVILFIGISPQPSARADQARGRILAEQQCSQCHAVKRDDLSPDPDAPSFADVAAEPSITEYMLRVFLKTPHPTMPNLIIKSNDVDDLVSYIMSLKPKKASARPNH